MVGVMTDSSEDQLPRHDGGPSRSRGRR